MSKVTIKIKCNPKYINNMYSTMMYVLYWSPKCASFLLLCRIVLLVLTFLWVYHTSQRHTGQVQVIITYRPNLSLPV